MGWESSALVSVARRAHHRVEPRAFVWTQPRLEDAYGWDLDPELPVWRTPAGAEAGYEV
jgi:hypothetical protein